MTLSLDDRLAPSDQIVFRELAGESVILDLKSGSYYGLNQVGTRVWAVVADGGTLRDANDVIFSEFEAPAHVIETEVLRFAAELHDQGLCRLVESR